MATEEIIARRRISHGGGLLVGEPSVVNFDGSVLNQQPGETAGPRTQHAGAAAVSYTGGGPISSTYGGAHQAAHGLMVHGNGQVPPGREMSKNAAVSGNVSALRLSPERSYNEVLPYSYVGVPASSSNNNGSGSTSNVAGKAGSSTKLSQSPNASGSGTHPAGCLCPVHRPLQAAVRFQAVGCATKPGQVVPVLLHAEQPSALNSVPSSMAVSSGTNQVQTNTVQQQGSNPLTPPSVAGVSCAPRLDGAWGGAVGPNAAPPERRKSVDLRNSTNAQQLAEGRAYPAGSYQIHVAGRGFGKQPGQAIMDAGVTRSPFTSTVSGMSMKLASLNTKFTQDILQQHESAHGKAAAYSRFLPTAASDESFSGSAGGRDPLVTILGSQRSAGNWWSQDDLSALPFEHARRSPGEARFSDDGFLSEYSRNVSWDGGSA